MSSSSMPPPPAPSTHRRNRINPNIQLPLSPPYSPESSPCLRRKMILSKGATFHVSSSVPTDDDPVLSIAHLPSRSPTCSQSALMSFMFDKEGVAAQSIQDFERSFAGARGKRSGNRRRGSDEFSRHLRTVKAALPSDEGLGSSISASSGKSFAKPLERSLDLLSDSALGTSVGESSIIEQNRIRLRGTSQAGPGVTSEDDGLSLEDLIQGSNNSQNPLQLQIRQRGISTHKPASSAAISAINQSISPLHTNHSSRQPNLSSFARKKIAQNILDPILREDRFKFFHPLVSSFGSKANNTIKCLRDLEQSLIFEPLTLAVSRHFYRTFGEFSIQLVIDTYQHLSETEQRRAADRPYDNGYFLDLVQQVGRLSAQINSARQARAARAETEDSEQEDEMAYSPDDEVTLEGGLGETGEPAELVRWKNGKGISLRTNEPYDSLPGIKRQHSDEALDEDVARSMARRKKNAVPKVVELKCSDKSCGKVFTRKCDLAKHDKTHLRPFKCPETDCKYHEQGLPTEKELERHVNDKHSKDPHYYHCDYCPFKTKRDSNCKQHMEKKHGWQYDRVKGNSKKTRTPGQTPQTPSLDYSPNLGGTPESSNIYSGSSVSGSVAGTPHEANMSYFREPMAGPSAPYHYDQTPFPPGGDIYATPADDFNFNSGYGMPTFDDPSPAISYEPTFNTTPISPTYNTPITPAHSRLSYEQSPYLNHMHMDINFGAHGSTYNTGLPTPGSNFLQPHSRDPSISHGSPMAPVMDQYIQPQISGFQGMNVNNFTAAPPMQIEDFTLFDSATNPATFQFPSDISADGDLDMFPGTENMDFNFTNDQLDDFVNL